MFIYKITAKNQIYIGLDTSPEYKMKRWKVHCAESKKDCPKLKLHQVMKEVGIKNCSFEIIDRNFTSIGKLALAEIQYINYYDSYRNGLNSSLGGDGLGYKNLALMSDYEILKIKEVLGSRLADYNKNIKWAGTTSAERKKMTSHLHTLEVQEKKSKTLKDFYKNNHEAVKEKSKLMKESWRQNYAKRSAQSRINGLKGAEKTSKKILAWTIDGIRIEYKSKSDFFRSTGLRANTVIKKTNEGIFYYGYKAKEI